MIKKFSIVLVLSLVSCASLNKARFQDENYIGNKTRMNEIFEQIMSFAFDINMKVLNN